MSEQQQTLSFDDLLLTLSDTSRPLPAAAIYRLSALPEHERVALTAEWPGLPVERRQVLLSRLTETSETDFKMDFSAVALMALDDVDGEVRKRAIACLWEVNKPSLMQRLKTMLEEDPEHDVREAAASALGRFVLLGELGKLPHDLTQPVEERLLAVWWDESESIDIRRRALESLAYTGLEEVVEMIEDAYHHEVSRLRASAVFAMGRNADQRWEPYILEELEGGEEELRYEAAQAAGELELRNAVPNLIELLEHDDIELRGTAIWALGEIGGQEARHALTRAAQLSANETLWEAIDDALSMAALAEGMLGLMELPDDEEL